MKKQSVLFFIFLLSVVSITSVYAIPPSETYMLEAINWSSSLNISFHLKEAVENKLVDRFSIIVNHLNDKNIQNLNKPKYKLLNAFFDSTFCMSSPAFIESIINLINRGLTKSHTYMTVEYSYVSENPSKKEAKIVKKFNLTSNKKCLKFLNHALENGGATKSGSSDSIFGPKVYFRLS